MNKSIKFLAENQEKDGSFLSLTSPRQNDFRRATKCQSVFSTALILSCLNALPDQSSKPLRDIKKKAVKFLLSQKSEHWSFNYWTRGSKQSKEMPYPDDLDDTSCALASLYEYDKGLIDGEVLAGMVTVLTLLEAKEGGPYRTWLVPSDAQKGWMDIDIAGNSNIGYLLSLQEVQLKNIIKLIESAIDEENYSSPYYPSAYPVIYFISRWYKEKKKKEIIDFLLKKQKNNNWGNPLDTALAVLALLNFGFSADKLKGSIEYIMRAKKEDGSWSAETFYTGINPNQHRGDKNKYYAGSASLTTAFCLEAISKISSGDGKDFGTSSTDKEEDEIYKKVTQRAKKSFSALGADLKKQAEVYLKKTIESDKNKEIILLPFFFARALNQKLSVGDTEKLVELGLANLYGWMAYTIYDDFLDDEGEPQMLSVANMAMRESYRIFGDALPDAHFVKSIFNRIDSANAWEIAHCRTKDRTIASALACLNFFRRKNLGGRAHPIPDFSDIAHLADRSLGHALGPMGVLRAHGHKIDSKESKKVLEAFSNYIAAKQIHDDMHDWEDDLSRGQINSASAELFSMVDTKSVPKDEKDALQFLQQKFWDETVVILCDRAFAHLDLAQKLFLSAGVSQSFADTILNPLRATTELTLRERSNAKKFIATYANNK